MKYILNSLLSFFIISLLTGCGESRQLSNTEKEFVGVWKYSDSNESNDENRYIKKNLELKKDGEFSFRININLDIKSWNKRHGNEILSYQTGYELQDVLELSLNLYGQWRIEGSNLYLNSGNNQPEFKVSKTFRGYLAYIASDVPKKALSRMEKVIEDYENTPIEKLMEKFNLSSEFEIISMENSSMTLRPVNGRNETFHRRDKKGTSTYVFNPTEESLAEDATDEELEVSQVERGNPEAEQLPLEIANGLTDPLSPQAGNTYDAKNLTDGDENTAWAVRLADTDYDSGDYLWGAESDAKRKKN